MALDYNGTTQYTDLGVIDLPGGSTQMSLFCWVYLDAIGDVRFIAKANGAASVGAAWWFTGVNGTGQKSRLKTGGTTTTLSGGGVYPTGTWIHTGFTYHSAGAGGAGWIGYRDGQPILTDAAKSGTIDVDPTLSVWIGGNPPFTDRQTDGRISDARIYDRALSAAEMETVFALRGRDNIVDGLLHRYLLNEGPPGVASVGAGSNKDVGPGQIDGTPVASPPFITDELHFLRQVA
jgi:hypothetical protein